jgi:hypothetical protein
VLESGWEMPKYTHLRIEEKAELPSGYWQNVAISTPFSKAPRFC